MTSPSSPDLTQYVDLTVYDVSPTDLVDRALLDAGLKLPDWTPRSGNTELVLMEALSLVVAELVFGINRLPAAVVESLLGLYGVVRSLGTPPTATATFTTVAPTGYDLAAGTTVQLTLPSGDPLRFTLDLSLTVPAGTSTVTGPVTADTATADANGIATGAALELLTAAPYVQGVVLASAVANGTAAEDDAAWISRGVQRLTRLTSTLVLPNHFQAAALDYPEVFRALAIDNYDGVGTNPGHVSVAVLGPSGLPLSGPAKTAVLTDLAGKAQANLAVHVIDPTITTVPVTVTVQALPGYDAATVIGNVTTKLAAYLSPVTWQWGSTVRYNELLSTIDQVVGVDYVATLGAPASDVVMGAAAPLPTLGVVSVTVGLP